MTKYEFSFEGLDVYKLALEVALWMRRAQWPAGSQQLRDQGLRAADSVVLNIAEGCSRGGKPGRNHLRIAMGSAGEAVAALSLADIRDGDGAKQMLRRVGTMLYRMQR